MSAIISKVGSCEIELEEDFFRSLTSSIVSQQISTKAANTIFGRFMDLIDDRLEPAVVQTYSLERLREVGLSRQKASYILDLSQKFHNNAAIYDHLNDLPDEEVIKHLTEVKGIGEWTAHMFLIFSLGRLDVLPHADLGFQNSLVRQYQLDSRPTKKQMMEIAETWHPYRSVAVWYLWQVYDQ